MTFSTRKPTQAEVDMYQDQAIVLTCGAQPWSPRHHSDDPYGIFKVSTLRALQATQGDVPDEDLVSLPDSEPASVPIPPAPDDDDDDDVFYDAIAIIGAVDDFYFFDVLDCKLSKTIVGRVFYFKF